MLEKTTRRRGACEDFAKAPTGFPAIAITSRMLMMEKQPHGVWRPAPESIGTKD